MSGLSHREFRDDDFWRFVPGWQQISRETFADHRWQARNSLTKLQQIQTILGDTVAPAVFKEMYAALRMAPMNIRLTPYILSLIDWQRPADDPIRKQFLPMAKELRKDHPFARIDSLNEENDSPASMLVHRYPDRVLFLPLATCPVYCAFCTRSRVIGGSTPRFSKVTYGANPKKWRDAFNYLEQHPEIEDVVISGGDVFNLKPEQLEMIGNTLLKIPHIRRIRYATKGLAVLPMKLLSDHAWFQALVRVHRRGRSMGKAVVIHTHFSSAREITQWTRLAMQRLFEAGVTVRNQSVLLEGVNHSLEEMSLLIKKLGFLHIQPYYLYLHDLVPGCEHFRTTLASALALEKKLRGVTSGFHMPTFVCDLPGGGGKRSVYSFEHYDRESGISAWTAPGVKHGELFYYFDPLHRLAGKAIGKWESPRQRQRMIKDVLERLGGGAATHFPLAV